jgi:hypothetical protein
MYRQRSPAEVSAGVAFEVPRAAQGPTKKRHALIRTRGALSYDRSSQACGDPGLPALTLPSGCLPSECRPSEFHSVC